MLPYDDQQLEENQDETSDNPQSKPNRNIISDVSNARRIVGKLNTASKTAQKVKLAAFLLNPEVWMVLGIASLIILIVLAIVIVFANLARDPADGGRTPPQEVNTENSLDQNEIKLIKALNSASNSEEMLQIVSEHKNKLKLIAALLSEEKIDATKLPDPNPPVTNKQEILTAIFDRISSNLDSVSADLKTDQRDKIFTSIRNDFKTLSDYATQYPKSN